MALKVKFSIGSLSPDRCDTGFTVLNPAYQNPDRRGRAGVAHGDKTIEDEKAYYTHRYSPAYQNPDRRGRAGVAHGDKTIEDEKACRFYSDVPFLEESLGHPLGGDRSCECSRQNN